MDKIKNRRFFRSKSLYNNNNNLKNNNIDISHISYSSYNKIKKI